RRVEAIYVARVEEMKAARGHRRRDETLRHVRERDEHLVLGERELRPERHPRDRRDAAGDGAPFEKLPSAEHRFVHHRDPPPFPLPRYRAFEAARTSAEIEPPFRG